MRRGAAGGEANRQNPQTLPNPRACAHQGRKLAGTLAAASDRLRGSAQEQVRKVLSPSAKAAAESKPAAAEPKQA